MASEIGKIVHCKICGAPIEARGNRLYCPVCYNQNRRNAAQRSNARTKMEREQTKHEEAKMKENNRIATSAAELNMRAKLSNLGGISYAALVSIEQEAALASDDEDDAAALERELSALEAPLPTPTTFDPSGIEEDEDDSESFDMDSWLAEDVPENEPDIETEIELETEEPELSVEPKQESAETDSEPPAKKEIAPKPAGMESDQNGKKDKTPSDTENPVKVNAFTKQENPVPVEEKPAPKQKPAKASKAKTPKTPESGTSKPATAPAPAPAKKPEADNRNDASLFGRGFQNRTTKGSGGGKKKANQSKKPEPYSEGEQMRFDGI